MSYMDINPARGISPPDPATETLQYELPAGSSVEIAIPDNAEFASFVMDARCYYIVSDDETAAIPDPITTGTGPNGDGSINSALLPDALIVKPYKRIKIRAHAATFLYIEFRQGVA